MPSTIAFLTEYLQPGTLRISAREVSYRRDGGELPATLYRPARSGRDLPGWVVLHGLTYRGREHPGLQRFARAVAASGAAVLIPEIPEWRRLRVAPALTTATIQAAILALDTSGESEAGRTGLIGFSFGATQALVAAMDPRLHGHLRALAAWGGYYDLHNLFRFGIAGEYELDDQHYHLQPDPYGRWIMAANYLTGIPGHEEELAVAEALGSLAAAAGRRGVYAWDASYDPLKSDLRAALEPQQRALFDLFAPLSTAPPPDPQLAARTAHALADAALRRDPLLDPKPLLPLVRCRVLIAHGRDDRLVPFTESIRLSRALPAAQLAGCTITGLFAHSGASPGGVLRLMRESRRFLRLLHDMLALV